MASVKKIALITGANSGIGNALAEKLIHQNYFVIGTSRNGKVGNINSENLFVVALDLNDQASIENANSIIRAKFKRIDLLVKNAGIAPDLDQPKPDLDLVSQKGQVLNISSITGF